MNLFDFIGAQNGRQALGGLSSLDMSDAKGGVRSMIDMAMKHQMKGFDDIGSVAKEMMTNAPEGVTQLFKGPWNFGE